MASVLPILLLCLFTQCAANNTYLCMLENAMYGGNFNLTVEPKYYMPNTNYTVTISGSAINGQVALSASINDTAFGNWENNATSCTGVSGTRNKTFNEMWTSPGEMDALTEPVEIRAYIQKSENTSYVMNASIPLASVSTTAAPTTTTTPPTTTTTPPTTTTTPTTITTTPTTITTTPTTMNNVTMSFNMTTTIANITMTSMTGNTTMSNMTMAATMSTTVKPTGGAITFKPLGGFASMLLLFVTVRELLL